LCLETPGQPREFPLPALAAEMGLRKGSGQAEDGPQGLSSASATEVRKDLARDG